MANNHSNDTKQHGNSAHDSQRRHPSTWTINSIDRSSYAHLICISEAQKKSITIAQACHSSRVDATSLPPQSSLHRSNNHTFPGLRRVSLPQDGMAETRQAATSNSRWAARLYRALLRSVRLLGMRPSVDAAEGGPIKCLGRFEDGDPAAKSGPAFDAGLADASSPEAVASRPGTREQSSASATSSRWLASATSR